MSGAAATIDLRADSLMPSAPASEVGPVKAWSAPVVIKTYPPNIADRNPMFFEKRVYQGSSGKVYPLPFIDRIATEPVNRSWKAIHIENEALRVMILPEIGGRVHIAYDKGNGYDFIYRQDVIKPSLVGLAGPWISGGIEFNWPQHHRPATFMEVNTYIERSDNGSVTVWCSDHDPMSRMKGMHGICLHPGKSLLEIKVRVFNRTPFVQSFLWWTNMAVRVHESYQSYFPPDVRFVADHAKRAITAFPLSDRPYYGVDYSARADRGVPTQDLPRKFRPDGSYPVNDLSWYANLPVPTSYMVTGTQGDFFGGYDHAVGAGLVHVANHHIAPGKKQWTWGNHEFGYAWDRNLSDDEGPYIELMAGVYTDNQPDFSYLAPGETRTFSQTVYPVREIGIPVAATTDAALSISLSGGVCLVGVCATREIPSATLTLSGEGGQQCQWVETIRQDTPLRVEREWNGDLVRVTLVSGGVEILRYDSSATLAVAAPTVALEPSLPEEVETSEELFLIGQHLAQYRHATRCPKSYWREAIRRDPQDSRANNALGLFHLRRGEFQLAEACFRTAIARLTSFNPNPYDGEPFYNLGQTLRFMDRLNDAYAAFYKATWNAPWQSCALAALAEIDMCRQEWTTADHHLKLSLRIDTENTNTRSMRAIVLRNLGHEREAQELLLDTLRIDPLALWTRHLAHGHLPHDGQERIDLAFDYARCGLWQEASSVLSDADTSVSDGAGPIILYALASFQVRMNHQPAARDTIHRASRLPTDYVFPSRIEEQLVLQHALAMNPNDARAAYYLGNCLYDRRRHKEAIALWERAIELDPSAPTAWRNLGIARFNIEQNSDGARQAYERAHQADPSDGRIIYERDQLWKRLGIKPEDRLQELRKFPLQMMERDSLAVEMATLLNTTGQSDRALLLLQSRRFQPWEGGEGLVLAQYVRANLLLGRMALLTGDPHVAIEYFSDALVVPANLGEAKHLLANESSTYYWLGEACEMLHDHLSAVRWRRLAASIQGDFRQMSARTVSDMTYWTALARRKLGDPSASDLFQKIFDESSAIEHNFPVTDYFATSLPSMLLFEEDLKQRHKVEGLFLRAQALHGMGQRKTAVEMLDTVLSVDVNHDAAFDLLGMLCSEHSVHGHRLGAEEL